MQRFLLRHRSSLIRVSILKRHKRKLNGNGPSLGARKTVTLALNLLLKKPLRRRQTKTRTKIALETHMTRTALSTGTLSAPTSRHLIAASPRLLKLSVEKLTQHLAKLAS